MDAVLTVFIDEFRPMDLVLSSLLARRRARYSRPGCFEVMADVDILAWSHLSDSSEVPRGMGARDTSMFVFDYCFALSMNVCVCLLGGMRSFCFN